MDNVSLFQFWKQNVAPSNLNKLYCVKSAKWLQIWDQTDIFIRISYHITSLKLIWVWWKKKEDVLWLWVSDHCELNPSGISEGTAQVDCLARIWQHFWLHLHSLAWHS